MARRPVSPSLHQSVSTPGATPDLMIVNTTAKRHKKHVRVYRSTPHEQYPQLLHPCGVSVVNKKEMRPTDGGAEREGYYR